MHELLKGFATTVADKAHVSAAEVERFRQLCREARMRGHVVSGRHLADMLYQVGFSASMVLKLRGQYERYPSVLARYPKMPSISADSMRRGRLHALPGHSPSS
jgi:hypothetical protein